MHGVRAGCAPGQGWTRGMHPRFGAELGRVGTVLLALGLGLWAPPVAAQRRALDYGLAVGSTALIVADWSQTLTIARDPCYCEGNVLLGRHPSAGRVNTYFGLVTAANLAALALPKTPRRVWYGAVIVIELLAVARNVAHAR
jgi:hypothetical protein